MPDYIVKDNTVIFKESFVQRDNLKIGFTQMSYNMGYVISGNDDSITYKRVFVGSLEDFLTILELCNDESNKV